MGDRWFAAHLGSFPTSGLLLELGCGPGEDAADLEAPGFEVVACDLLDSALRSARELIGTRRLLRVDHRLALPFRDAAFEGVVASLSLHYFAVAGHAGGVRRGASRAGLGWPAPLPRHATDDVEFGANEGVEVEPNLRSYDSMALSAGWARPLASYGELKRFFDEQAVRDALGTGFAIELLRHAQVNRWRRPKQVWECVARAV